MDNTEVATGVTSTSYTQNGLSAGTTYAFKVRARNAVGLSSYSQVISIVAATIPSKPNAPTTSVIDEYQISVTWNLPTD